MSANPQSFDRDSWELQSIAALAEIEAELDDLVALIERMPDWRPGSALLAQAAWLQKKLQQIRASWDSRLVVAIVGPSGTGKSTLLNALAGAELAETGLTRPTTRHVTAYAGEATAADPLRQELGDTAMRIVTSGRAEALEYLTLLDTPDTNTLPENQAILRRVLERADLILAIFPAQNPRLHDNLAFLRPFVERLPHDHVIPVLNMIDRVPADELDEVVGDFHRALRSEWGLAPERIYRISAKRSSPDSRFPADETPLNEVNEFPELEQLVFTTLNRASQLVDRRTARAQRLFELYRGQARHTIATTEPERADAERALAQLEQRVEETAHRTMPSALAGVRGLDLGATLYSMLSSRWWGPVGWLVGLWALILRVSSFVTRLGRRLPSVLASSSAEDSVSQDESLLDAFPTDEVANLLLSAWPSLSDALVAAGFDPAMRSSSAWQERLDTALEELAGQSAAHYSARLGRLAERLSSWPIQLLLNVPVLGMVGWIGVEAVLAFVQRRYLPSTYFQNGAMAVAAIWVLAYVLLQIMVSASIHRLKGGGLYRELGRGLAESIVEPWQEQLQGIEELEAQLEP